MLGGAGEPRPYANNPPARRRSDTDDPGDGGEEAPRQPEVLAPGGGGATRSDVAGGYRRTERRVEPNRSRMSSRSGRVTACGRNR